MKIPHPFWTSMKAVGAAALLCLAQACKPAVPPQGPAKTTASPAKTTNTAATPTNKLSAEYASTFVELMPPKGRDPFFPNSTRRDQKPAAPAPKVVEKAQVAVGLVLKGIIGKERRLAIFNNSAMMEVGDSGKVLVPNGSVRLKVLEIGEDYAKVQVEGEQQPRKILKNKGP